MCKWGEQRTNWKNIPFIFAGDILSSLKFIGLVFRLCVLWEGIDYSRRWYVSFVNRRIVQSDIIFIVIIAIIFKWLFARAFVSRLVTSSAMIWTCGSISLFNIFSLLPLPSSQKEGSLDLMMDQTFLWQSWIHASVTHLSWNIQEKRCSDILQLCSILLQWLAQPCPYLNEGFDFWYPKSLLLLSWHVVICQWKEGKMNGLVTWMVMENKRNSPIHFPQGTSSGENSCKLVQICVRLEYEEMCIPEKHRFLQAVHKFGNKFVHSLHKFVRLCNMESLQWV